MKPDQTPLQVTNHSSFQKLMRNPLFIFGVIVVISISGLVIYRNSHFRFLGLKANGNKLSSNSVVILRFNRELADTQKTIDSVKINPRLDTDIVLTGDKKNIVISPVNSLLLNTTYTVTIPLVTSVDGNKLQNIVVNFEAKNKLDDTENSVDLEDIIGSRYPQLEELEKENPDYNIGHGLEDNTLILTILLTPKRDITLTEEEKVVVLKNINQKLLDKIKNSGINLRSLGLRYENAYQNDLLYSDSIRFLKQDQPGG